MPGLVRGADTGERETGEGGRGRARGREGGRQRGRETESCFDVEKGEVL